jgi:hypothetical protein
MSRRYAHRLMGNGPIANGGSGRQQKKLVMFLILLVVLLVVPLLGYIPWSDRITKEVCREG